MPEPVECKRGEKSPVTGRVYGRHPALVTRDRLLDAWNEWSARLSEYEGDCLSVTVVALERIAIEAENAGPKPPAECGTVSGRQRHRRSSEQPCPACKQAWADYMSQWRKNRTREEPTP